MRALRVRGLCLCGLSINVMLRPGVFEGLVGRPCFPHREHDDGEFSRSSDLRLLLLSP